MKRLTTTFAFACALALCARVAAAAGTPADWPEVAAGPMFTVHAPAGTSFERIRTGDAFAGTFHGPGFEAAVEFGYNREAMKTPDGAANPNVTNIVVDEKPGTVTTATLTDPTHPRFIALHVPSVETDLLGPLKLIVTARVAKSEDEATLRAIFGSVKFGYKN